MKGKKMSSILNNKGNQWESPQDSTYDGIIILKWIIFKVDIIFMFKGRSKNNNNKWTDDKSQQNGNKKINSRSEKFHIWKNLLAAFYSRLETTDKKNSKLKVRLAESIQFEVTRQKY